MVPPSQEPVSGGGTVALRGVAWEPGRIEVRWQSRYGARLPVTGQSTVGSGSDRSFSIQVTIPDRITEGTTYTLFVVGPSTVNPDGVSTTDNALPVTIIGGQPRVVEPVSEPTEPTPATPAPAAAGPATARPATALAAEDTSVFEPTDAAAPAAAATRSPTVAAAPTRTGSPTVAAPVRGLDGTAVAVPQPATAEVAPVVPGAQTAGGDLWSGFATGDRPGASLVGPATVPANDGGMGAGLAILGIGILALMGGTAAALRRRPVKVITKD